MPRVLASAFVAVWLLPGADAGGQVSTAWTFEELRAASDIVIIATAGETLDTGTKAELSDLMPPLPVVELSTEFRVLSVLKGELAGQQTLQLRHYRLDFDRIGSGCLNCGGLIEFSATAPATPACRAGDVSPTLPSSCDYLLFLKRLDGAWVPTAGDIFPAKSVLLLRRAG